MGNISGYGCHEIIITPNRRPVEIEDSHRSEYSFLGNDFVVKHRIIQQFETLDETTENCFRDIDSVRTMIIKGIYQILLRK